MIYVWIKIQSFNRYYSYLCTHVINNRTGGHSCSKEFSFNVDAHCYIGLLDLFFLDYVVFTWLNQTKKTQKSRFPHEKRKTSQHDFALMCSTIFNLPWLAWHCFVCAEQQFPLAGCAESEVVWYHDRMHCINDQKALAYHQVSLKVRLSGAVK